MEFTVRDRYACSAERFWSEVFFEEDYNRPLYLEALQFQAFDVLTLSAEPNGDRTRRVKVMPRLDAPAPVRKVIGDALTYIEEGRYDAAQGRWSTRIVPSVMPDKISIRSDMWMDPVGDHECDRVAHFQVNVRVFGLGKIFERFVEKTLRESYAEAARFTNTWLMKRWG